MPVTCGACLTRRGGGPGGKHRDPLPPWSEFAFEPPIFLSPFPHSPQDRVDRIMQAADKNGDGRIGVWHWVAHLQAAALAQKLGWTWTAVLLDPCDAPSSLRLQTTRSSAACFARAAEAKASAVHQKLEAGA